MIRMMVFFFRKGSEGSYGTDRVGDVIGPGWEPLKGTAKDMLSWSTLFLFIVSACKCKYTCLFVSVIIRSYLSFFYASIYIYIYIYICLSMKTRNPDTLCFPLKWSVWMGSFWKISTVLDVPPQLKFNNLTLVNLTIVKQMVSPAKYLYHETHPRPVR